MIENDYSELPAQAAPTGRAGLIGFVAGCGLAVSAVLCFALLYLLGLLPRPPFAVAIRAATPTPVPTRYTPEPDFIATPILTIPATAPLIVTLTPAPTPLPPLTRAVTRAPTAALVPTSVPIPSITPLPNPTSFVPLPPTPFGPGLPPSDLPFPGLTPPFGLPTAPAPLPGQQARTGNGPDAVARYVPPGAFVPDGRPDEWGASGMPLTIPHFGPEAWQGPDDLSGTAMLGWNEQYLFFAATVRDDVHVQTQSSWEMFRGDSVELWIDADLQGDFNNPAGNRDDYQFGFSPGDFQALPPEGVVYIPFRDLGVNDQILVEAMLVPGGYALEAAIPWSVLGIQPVRGLMLGYSVDISDNDAPGTAQQQTQVTNNPTFQFNVPTTFGNLLLE